MNYESATTAKVKEILSLVDMGVSPEELSALEHQLSEDDSRLADWLQEEQSKPELVRDLKREQIAVQGLTARVDEVLKPMRERAKKATAIVKERADRKAAALAECNSVCRRAHDELTKVLQKHGVRADDMGEAVYKVLAYTSLAK